MTIAMSSLRWIFFGLLIGACGSDDDTTDGDGVEPMTSACGLAGAVVGEECTGLDECGAGEPNFSPVNFCENCFAGPDTHVCESGVCRALDAQGRLRVGFAVPAAAAGAKSFAVAVVLPVMADGTRVSCESLVSAACDTIDNRMINTSNSTFQNFTQPAGGADPSFAYTYGTSADVGTDRIVLITVTEDEQGRGAPIARGCVDGIEVLAGQSTEVTVEPTPL